MNWLLFWRRWCLWRNILSVWKSFETFCFVITHAHASHHVSKVTVSDFVVRYRVCVLGLMRFAKQAEYDAIQWIVVNEVTHLPLDQSQSSTHSTRQHWSISKEGHVTFPWHRHTILTIPWLMRSFRGKCGRATCRVVKQQQLTLSRRASRQCFDRATVRRKYISYDWLSLRPPSPIRTPLKAVRLLNWSQSCTQVSFTKFTSACVAVKLTSVNKHKLNDFFKVFNFAWNKTKAKDEAERKSIKRKCGTKQLRHRGRDGVRNSALLSRRRWAIYLPYNF